MARNGYRHRLVLYTYTLNRWWRLTLVIGVLLVLLTVALAVLPGMLPQAHFLALQDWIIWTAGGMGGFILLMSLFLITIRKSAYVQPFPNHLRLVTPLLRMDIAYRRIRQATSVEMQRLFPIERSKGIKRSMLRHFAKNTAILLDMQGWPMPRWLLNLFLSPLFFPDKSSRLALLVPDWMAFSTDMESFRGTWLDSQRQPGASPQSDLLHSLSQPKRR